MATTLVVGTNSYVTLSEANDIIDANYVPTELIATQWNALSDFEKEVYLIRSARQIDRMMLSGYKTQTTQVMGFPRNGTLEVPSEVKEAQVVNSIALSDPQVQVGGNPVLRDVKSYSIDDFSETFAAGAKTAYNTSLASNDATNILWQWLRGGYLIR